MVIKTLLHNALWLRIVTIFIIGAVLTGFAFQVTRALEDQQIAQDLAIGATNRIAAIQHGFDEQRQLLESVAAYWTVSGGTNYNEFRAFVTPLLPRNSELAGIGWAPMVTFAQRSATEEAMRNEGLPDYQITERNAEGALVRAAEREFYVPVLYIEPLQDNEVAVGFDLWSEQNRRQTLTAARDTGLPHTTRQLHLVQEQLPRDGLLSALAVYRRGANLDTVDARRDALLGYISQVYWIDEVIEAALAGFVPSGIDLYFLDSDELADTTPNYVHNSRTRTPVDDAPTLSQRLLTETVIQRARIDVIGREWQVVSLPTPDFVNARHGPLPWVLLAVGVIATMLGTIAVWARERRANKLQLAHAELQASEARLREVVENMPVLMSALDNSGNIIAWNKESMRVLGFSASEVRGEDVFGDLYSATGLNSKGTNISGMDDYHDQERKVTTSDGSERTIAWSKVSNAIPIPGWASWHIGIDVTERNRANRERQKMQKQLLQTQKLESLGLFAGGIAHDFNNLLTVIMGNASLAKESVGTSSPAWAALEDVVQASNRAALLTQQLLAYTGKGAFEKISIDLSEHVREVGSLLRAAIPKKVNLIFELQPDLPAVNADPAQIQQLIMNLVINAAEAAVEQTGTVMVKTGLQTLAQPRTKTLHARDELPPGTYVYLEIQDNGQGMNAETQMRIFDPFYSTKFTGRGLGLSAALGIVSAHGGRLNVESEPGKGSIFTVLLPASGEAAHPPHQPANENIQGKGNILVVDDELLIRQVATAILTSLGYQVTCAADGEIALEIFAARGAEFDCVLLDLTMPKLDGHETFKGLLKRRPDVTVILASGYDESDAKDRFRDMVPAGFLNKPFTAAQLGEKIREVLAIKAHKNRHTVITLKLRSSNKQVH